MFFRNDWTVDLAFARRPAFVRRAAAGGTTACLLAGVAALAAALAGNPDARLWRTALLPERAPTQYFLSAWPAGSSPAHAAIPASTSAADAAPESAVLLLSRFLEQGYTLARIRGDEAAVPRVLLNRLPTDMSQIESRDLRKNVFIKMLLPLLLVENERIGLDRERLLKVRERVERREDLRGSDVDWLTDLAQRYAVPPADLDELVRRVDAIPPSLALAQAALETGWGTSRVAIRGHAMFGQMLFRQGGEDLAAAVRTFDDLAAAVNAYAANLNTHRAYARFRTERAASRERGEVLDGHELAGHLRLYSERGMDYVRAVQVIIRANNLRPLDPARLAG